MADLNLADRLKRIEQLEDELMRKGAGILGAGADLSHADFFIFGAMRRTLAQASGFRDLINARNFPCAAAILRLQLDTAMRVNALSIVDDVDSTCKAVLDGEQFNRLKDRDGNKLSDAHIRKKLAETHPWISPVYERTSDFAHLSGTISKCRSPVRTMKRAWRTSRSADMILIEVTKPTSRPSTLSSKRLNWRGYCFSPSGRCAIGGKP